jgi:2,4-dienoyl-CoA reductase-like NADH-dependent reductase (Old Yellow Enzyme family)
MAADTLEQELPLFRAITLAGVALKNRLVLSPMCTYSARHGMADDFHLTHIAKFAMGASGWSSPKRPRSPWTAGSPTAISASGTMVKSRACAG